MGWLVFDEDSWETEHEGYVLAVERDGFGWRELGLDDSSRGKHPVSWLQLGCECGWRSARFVAPFGTDWAPCSVMMNEQTEDAMCALWRAEHRDRLTDFDLARHKAVPSHLNNLLKC